jgi:hypothetical protein
MEIMSLVIFTLLLQAEEAPKNRMEKDQTASILMMIKNQEELILTQGIRITV